MIPKHLPVKGDEGIRSRLQGSVEPVERGDEIAKAGSWVATQAICRYLDRRQIDDSKAAKGVIEALDQRRQPVLVATLKCAKVASWN